jgi:hypothetical protein
MTNKHIATVSPLPSSILHNSTEIRRQYIRAASKQAARFISQKVRSLHRKAETAVPEMTQMHGGH